MIQHTNHDLITAHGADFSIRDKSNAGIWITVISPVWYSPNHSVPVISVALEVHIGGKEIEVWVKVVLNVNVLVSYCNITTLIRGTPASTDGKVIRAPVRKTVDKTHDYSIRRRTVVLHSPRTTRYIGICALSTLYNPGGWLNAVKKSSSQKG